MVEDYLNYTTELTEDKITEKLQDYNSKWDRYSNELFPKFDAYYNMYAKMEHTVEGVNVKIPAVFQTIEVETPHLLNNIFAQSMVVDATAKFQDPDESRTYRVKNYINKLIKDECDGRRKTELIIKNMLIYGYSIIKCFWNLNPDIDIDPVSKQVIPVNSAHPDFYMVDNYSFAFDPEFDGQKIDEIEWCRERVFISKNKMKQMRDNGECGQFTEDDMTSTDDKGKKSRSPNKKQEGKTFYDEFYCTLYDKVPSNEPMMDENGQPMMDENGMPMVDETKTNTVSKEYRIWLLANNKIVKFEENLYGYKPFTAVRCYGVPFKFIGHGEGWAIGAIANQLSMVNYQAGKMVKKLGQSVTWVGPNAGLSPYNLERIESGVVFLKDISQVRSEQSFDPQNVEVMMKYGEYLQTELESVTGVTKFLQGTDIGDMTATQASLVSQNSTNRLATKLVHLQEDFIVPIAEMFFMMNKQLLNSPVDFIDNNNNLINLQPEDFFGNYIWTSTSPTSISNKALQLQQNGDLLQKFLQASQASKMTPFPFSVDIPMFIDKFIASNANMPNIQSILVPDAPVSPGTPPGMPPQASQQPQGPSTSAVPQGPTPPGNAGSAPGVSQYPMSSPPPTPHPGGPVGPVGPL